MSKPNTRNQGANDERTAILAHVKRVRRRAAAHKERTYKLDALISWIQERAERCRKKAGGLGRVAALLLGLALLAGCAGTNTQRVLLATSEAAATAVNTTYDTWGLTAVARARAVLVTNAPPEVIVAQIKSNPKDAEIVALYNDWRAQTLVWSAWNKTLTSGTNAVTVLSSDQFRIDLANLGNRLLDAIAQSTQQPQPHLKP